MKRILVINPGATSTKFAVFENDKELFKKTVDHSMQELKDFSKVFDQHRYRLYLILKKL